MKEIAAIIIFPLLLIILLPWIVMDWLKEPGRKKEYHRSHYYRDLQVPYHKGILCEDSYLFYNEAKDDHLQIKIIHPANGGADYLLVRDSIYLFPMCQHIFGGIAYHAGEKTWKVDLDGDFNSLDEEWEKYKAQLGAAEQEMPCYLLIRKDDVHPSFDDQKEAYDDFAWNCLPPYVRLVAEYRECIMEG